MRADSAPAERPRGVPPPWAMGGTVGPDMQRFTYAILIESLGNTTAAVQRSFASRFSHSYHNLVFGRPKIFDMYCEWLFGVLGKIDGYVARSPSLWSLFARPRAMAQLSERLENIFIFAHAELEILFVPHAHLEVGKGGKASKVRFTAEVGK